MPVWLPVAAPEDPARRINQGDEAITAEDLREVAASYDPSWRAASLICGYDPQTGRGGPAHWEGRWRPEVSPIEEYRFNEESQELEASVEVGSRFRELFDLGFRTPSIGIVALPDHPSGETRQYGQHVAMTGPGELEIIAGLGGERWADRIRALQEDLSSFGDSMRYSRFRTLTTEEIPMADEPTLPLEEPAAEPQQTADPPEPAAEDPPAEPRQRAADPDPVAEVGERLRALQETVETLAGTVQTLAAGQADATADAERVRTAAAEAEALATQMRERAQADHESRIRREVEALASGSEPRMRTADVEFTTRALLAMEPADAEAELERFRARDPIVTGLGDELETGDLGGELPEGFDIERYRSNDGTLPDLDQVRQYVQLANAGNGDAVAAATARERGNQLRRSYLHG